MNKRNLYGFVPLAVFVFITVGCDVFIDEAIGHEGGSCARYGHCYAGLFCEENTCKAQLGLGENCDPNVNDQHFSSDLARPCQPPFGCGCDGEIYDNCTCREVGGEGQLCDENAGCDGDRFCYCGVEPCDDDYYQYSEYREYEDFDNPFARCLSHGGLNQPCTFTEGSSSYIGWMSSCGDDLVCKCGDEDCETGRLCRATGGLDQYCEVEAYACDQGLTCWCDDAFRPCEVGRDGICIEVGGEGQFCVDSVVECDPGLTCWCEDEPCDFNDYFNDTSGLCKP